MRIVISAGPTREPIDPVRFLSNRSTGRMGYALASAAVKRGWETILVSGPVALAAPEGLAGLVRVETAADMAEAMKREAQNADCIIMCAAVADYRPVKVAERKLKKSDGGMVLELEPTEDVLLSLGRIKRSGQLLVGFAAETDAVETYALDKLKRKNLDWIAANRVGVPGEGFESENNAVVLFSRRGEKIVLPLDSKEKIAGQILERILPDGRRQGDRL